MPTFSSSMYPYGYSGQLVGTRTGSYREPQKPKLSTSRNSSSNTAQQLLNLMNKGQNITRQEYNVPWQNYMQLLNQPLNSESRLQDAYSGWQKMYQQPGMTDTEANKMYGIQSDMTANALRTALENVARTRPGGIGATVEAEDEARQAATNNLLESQRAIDIEKLQSEREGRTTALSGLSSTAQAMSSAAQADYGARTNVLDALMNMAQARQQADLTGQMSAGELLAQVVAGKIPSDLLSTLTRAISQQQQGLGNYYGTGTTTPQTGGKISLNRSGGKWR